MSSASSSTIVGDAPSSDSYRRSLEKKLRQIEKLKHKRNRSGDAALDDRQQNKIQREAAVRADLARLNGEPACNHCGRIGHAPRVCTYGLAEDESFLLCRGTQPASPCFPRTFIVPLRRAAPNFDPDALRDGRVDVGLRCVSSGLFRSQSLRQNSRVLLCFGVPEAEAEASSSSSSSGPPRVVEVDGALVRDLRPDELSLAKRIRAVSDSAGGARAAAARSEAAQATAQSAQQREADADDGPVGLWSRGETRGLSSMPGEMLDALKYALSSAGSPPMLLLLNANGQFIGDLCSELASNAASTSSTNPLSGGVVVLLGDDRGLSSDEERQVLALAEKRGSLVKTVSLGEDVLFASHSIVLVHHYLDRALHSCLVKAPRQLVRGGGKGGGGRGKGGR